MQVFKCEYDLPLGKINHNVHIDWDDKGNLHFAEHDLGDGVKQVWEVVPRGGIEPPTQGFSVLCSTD